MFLETQGKDQLLEVIPRVPEKKKKKDVEWLRTEFLRTGEKSPCRMDSTQAHWRMWRAGETTEIHYMYSYSVWTSLFQRQRFAPQLANLALPLMVQRG